MKPLTIDGIKSFKVGDWLWVELIHCLEDVDRFTEGSYCQIQSKEYCGDTVLPLQHGSIFDCLLYEDYGTKWLAYKNKEQAEAKGEIIELPFMRQRKLDGDWEVVSIHPDGFTKIEMFTNEQNAKRRLAELKGEKDVK